MAEVKKRLSCYHCGDTINISGQALLYKDKAFCCLGCRAAYQLLERHDLCTYYELDEKAGVKIEDTHWAERYHFLDSHDVVATLLDYQDNECSVARLYLPAVHCSSCVWLLEHLPCLHEGVVQARLSFAKKILQVRFRHQQLSLKELAVLLARLGYAPLIRMDNTAVEHAQKHTDHTFYWKLGVAGFCAGNIMLLSFPEYFSLSQVVEEQYLRFFQYLNAILVLPVFFYSGIDYLRGGWQSIRNFVLGKYRYLSLDVPLSLGMWAMFFRSAYETFYLGQAGYWDSLAALVFFLLIGKWVQSRTYEHLSFERDYRSYFPLAVKRRTAGGTYESVPVRQLQAGDCIRLHHEEVLPCDARLQSQSAQLDYSFVTGESRPVTLEQGSLLFAGARVIGHAIEVIVQKPVEQSYLVSLWAQSQQAEKQIPVRFVDVIAQYFTFITLFIALLAMLVWAIWLSKPDQAWLVLTSVLIVACPCALALSTPFTLGAAMAVLARHGLFVRSQEVIERLRSVTHVVMDKTGTLTETRHSHIEWQGKPLSLHDKKLIRSLAIQSSHPLSRSIAAYLGEGDVYAVESFREQKGMGIAAQVGQEIVRLGSARFVGLSDDRQETDEAFSYVYVAVNTLVLGCFQLRPFYRHGLAEVLVSLRRMGYRLSLLSGDRKQSARYFETFFRPTEMHLEQSPHDKLRFIDKLQQQGEKVLMLGDGLNDAGALRRSHVGIAIAEEVHAFSPACDALMEAKCFARLPAILRYVQKSRYVLRSTLVLSLLYNTVGIAWAVSGSLSPVLAAILMPLSSISVVLLATLGARWYALRMFKKNS